MIVKSFDFLRFNLNENYFFLFYGENEGYKNEIIEEKFKKLYDDNIYIYEENEVLKNEEVFFNNILSKSFFENKKLVIISRATDKIKNIVEEILEKKIEDLVLILNASILEKKSQLRSLFEKNKKTIVCHFMKIIIKPYLE